MEHNALEVASKELHCREQDLSVKEVSTEFFRQWHFWHVHDNVLPPSVLMLATNHNDTRRIRIEEGFEPETASEPVSLHHADAAVRYVKFFLSVAEPMGDVLKSVDDIPGVTEKEKQAWRERIKGPSGRPDGKGYAVDLWLWKQGQLMQGHFVVDAVGRIQPKIKTVAAQIGVDITLE